MIGTGPLFSLLRDDVPEVLVRGEIVVASPREVLYASGDAIGSYPARSVMKPFQFLATGLAKDLGKGERLPAHLVPAVGSISATSEQLEQLHRWYDAEPFRHRLPRLQLPASYPLGETARGAARAAGRGPDVWSNNCFSKHMAVLEACEREGWDPAGYLRREHPYFRRLVAVLAECLEEPGLSPPTVTDGCRLPSPVLSSVQLAKLYARLAGAPDGAPLAAIRRAMIEVPEWIGGPDRHDTRLAQRNAGRVFAKEGADGLLAIGITPDDKYRSGLGILVKLEGGYLPNFAAAAAAPILEALGLAPGHDVPGGQTLRYHYRFGERAPRFLDVSPLVGERIAVWPGDEAFRRTASMSTLTGSHMTLSSMTTTMHVGAHTDAPNHFEAVATGIDEVDPGIYAGICQVIEVSVPRGDVIRPEHVQGVVIGARRVLFRTGSFPDPTRFDRDFVALSAAIVEWLAERGVILVGIDTPSIDPFSSKELAAHHATTRARMAILEGIVLDAVTPGYYELCAVPLRLEGADASPVRALLRPLP